MENIRLNNQINEGQSYEKSLAIAKELFKKYKTEIDIAATENPDPEVGQFHENAAIRHFLKKIPEDVQQKFSGHGISKGYLVEQLAAVINICANKAMKGMYGRLGGEAQFAAYDHGSALILSKSGENFGAWDADGKQVSHEVVNGVKINIGAVVLNSAFYPLCEELKKLFPDVNIIKANELPNYLIKK